MPKGRYHWSAQERRPYIPHPDSVSCKTACNHDEVDTITCLTTNHLNLYL
ncbi:MAG: hypothetical protein II943_10090 [Victivallales bacterium]|nr:hypothetical protein [Victivallales bacterium]